MTAEALAVAKTRKRARLTKARLDKYAEDPVGFGEDILGESFTDDVKAVMESVLRNPVTVAQSANSTGKSHGAARAAAWFFKVFADAKVYMTAAPPFENLKKILWGEVMAVTMKKPELFATDQVRSLDIYRNKQSFMTGVAIPMQGKAEERETKFSGKHAPHLLFVVDEGDAVPEEVYKGIESCMSGGFCRLLIMFNPKMQSGYVYRLIKNNQANVVKLSAFNHPNVLTGEEKIPGAVDRTVTIRRIQEWTRPLAENERRGPDCYDLPDFLVGAVAIAHNGQPYPPLAAGVRKIIEPTFSYMVMGEYPAQGAMALISDTWLDAARNRFDLYVAKFGEVPPVGIRPKLGLDVAELGTDGNVACLRWGGYVPRFNSQTLWNGVDSDMTAVMCLQLYLQNDVEIAYIDATGVGSSVAPSMARMGKKDGNHIRAVGVKAAGKPSPFITSELGDFGQMRDQLWWQMREWLREDPNAMLPPDPLMIDDLRAAEYEVVGDKIKLMEKKVFREKLKRSPDRGDALAMTFAPYERPKILKIQV